MFIISNNLAIRISSSKSFRELLIGVKGEGSFTIPNRNIIGDEITKIYRNARLKLFSKLEAYPLCHWKSPLLELDCQGFLHTHSISIL
jgi:hypothetical protein